MLQFAMLLHIYGMGDEGFQDQLTCWPHHLLTRYDGRLSPNNLRYPPLMLVRKMKVTREERPTQLSSVDEKYSYTSSRVVRVGHKT